jgi:hypothetical protein
VHIRKRRPYRRLRQAHVLDVREGTHSVAPPSAAALTPRSIAADSVVRQCRSLAAAASAAHRKSVAAGGAGRPLIDPAGQSSACCAAALSPPPTAPSWSVLCACSASVGDV